VVVSAVVVADLAVEAHQEAGNDVMIMKTLAQNFLTEDEQQRITETVHRAEQITSGEIVPMVVSRSSDYSAAAITGSLLSSFLLSLGLSPLIGKALWLGSNNMLLFIAIFLILFFIFSLLTGYVPAIKRFFLSKKEIEREVEEHAITSFFQENLYKTKDANGILIFISVFEHKVIILGDSGINERIDPDSWKNIVSDTTAGIREHKQCDAICTAIEQVGTLLKDHFPIKDDDENELHNLIIK